ncbi:tubulin-folding cofactor B [Numida meleagris]|uniref:tubulin-folding cofactor B n=1 Tax=Numida meleagris TaxID=8996 RepID=UPI000B3E0911|nr:tubulin-folding cofactor B [Numida meleagris]
MAPWVELELLWPLYDPAGPRVSLQRKLELVVGAVRKLELVVGAAAPWMELELRGTGGELLARLEPDDALLGAFPVSDGCGLHRRADPPELTEVTKATQATRAELRRRFLLSLAAARGQPVTFVLCQRVRVSAVLGAACVPDGTEVAGDDGSAAVAFQVDALQTPLGVQAAALLRGRDVVAFGFRAAEKRGK